MPKTKTYLKENLMSKNKFLNQTNIVSVLLIIFTILFSGLNQILGTINGLGSGARFIIVAIVSYAPLMYYYFARRNYLNMEISPASYRKVSIPSFISLLAILLSVAFFGGILSATISKLIPTATASSNSQDASLDILLIIYTCILGPILEELAWRGLLQSSLNRFGYRFAIIFSSLAFALMHHDIEQGIAAFCTGVFFAIVRKNYGLIMSIILHIVNNSWVELSSYLNNHDSGKQVSAIVIILALLITLITLVIFVIKKLKRKSTEEKFSFAGEKFDLIKYFLFPLLLVLDLILTMSGRF